MESNCELSLPLIIEVELVEKATPSVTEEIQGIADLDVSIGFYRGVFLCILFSIPIWALILWMVL